MPKLKKRPDGRYQTKVITEHDDNGKAIYKFIYAANTTELEAKKKKVLEKVSRSSYIDGDKCTLAQWLDEWINHIINDSIRQNTWESYETIIRVQLIPGLGDTVLSEIQPQTIRKFYDEKKKKYSDRYVNYMQLSGLLTLQPVAENDNKTSEK